jgi:hypothetical protein
MSNAGVLPIVLARRADPPHAGVSPRSISGSPKPERASEWQFETAAKAITKQRRHRRLAHRLDPRDEINPLIEEGIDADVRHPSAKFLEVHTDRKVFRALGGDHESPDCVVSGDVLDDRFELVDIGKCHPIERIVIGRNNSQG